MGACTESVDGRRWGDELGRRRVRDVIRCGDKVAGHRAERTAAHREIVKGKAKIHLEAATEVRAADGSVTAAWALQPRSANPAALRPMLG